jgi:hypothetical protein
VKSATKDCVVVVVVAVVVVDPSLVKTSFIKALSGTEVNLVARSLVDY